MKQNKGFTLIELLAVIVILAVIALIATPLVMSTINDARKNSAINSAYGYIKALEVSMSTAMANDTSLNLTNGDFVVETATAAGSYTYKYAIGTGSDTAITSGVKALTVSFQGDTPSKVELQISDGKISGGTLIINNFELSVNADGKVTYRKTVK